MNAIPVERLVTVPEIARRLGFTITRVRRWTDRRDSNGFPSPVKQTGKFYLYDMSEIEAWVAEHRKKWGVYYKEASNG